MEAGAIGIKLRDLHGAAEPVCQDQRPAAGCQRRRKGVPGYLHGHVEVFSLKAKVAGNSAA